MTREERRVHWREIIAQQDESGLNGAAFCLQHDINPQRFYHWRRRLQKEGPNSSSHFFELVPCSSQPRGSGMSIHLGDELHYWKAGNEVKTLIFSCMLGIVLGMPLK